MANYRKNGHSYTLYKVGLKSCIYEQMFSQIHIGYEVFLIREKKESVLFGKISPAKFHIPSNEDFGKWAWSCRTLDCAMKTFNELENN